jgi:hypothetical protein
MHRRRRLVAPLAALAGPDDHDVFLFRVNANDGCTVTLSTSSMVDLCSTCPTSTYAAPLPLPSPGSRFLRRRSIGSPRRLLPSDEAVPIVIDVNGSTESLGAQVAFEAQVRGSYRIGVRSSGCPGGFRLGVVRGAPSPRELQPPVVH